MSNYTLAARVYSKTLALIYFIAFWSLFKEVLGLFGSTGIVPITNLFQRFPLSFQWVSTIPSIFWINSSDIALKSAVIAGMILSIIALFGILPTVFFTLLWILYLSFMVVGYPFLNFQWDILLLELGFLSIFLYPITQIRATEPSRWIVWGIRIVLFKLFFSSGLIKILSQDPVWRNLSALQFHYFTQPLPHIISWVVNLLPAWFHKLSAIIMFIIELVVPFLIFVSDRLRFVAFWILSIFMLLIVLTGNYTFFNILTIAALTILVPDTYWRKIGTKWNHIISNSTLNRFHWIPRFTDIPSVQNTPTNTFKPYGTLALLIGLSIINISQSLGRFIQPTANILPKPMQKTITNFHIANDYGLFARMTTQRFEIELLASMDGQNWEPYIFKYKPGPINRKPPFVMPLQPRLDWQMWFLPFSSYQNHEWLYLLCMRLFEQEPTVLRFFEKVPFEGQSPALLKAVAYNYTFTSWDEHKRLGTWWKRELAGDYFPILANPN